MTIKRDITTKCEADDWQVTASGRLIDIECEGSMVCVSWDQWNAIRDEIERLRPLVTEDAA